MQANLPRGFEAGLLRGLCFKDEEWSFNASAFLKLRPQSSHSTRFPALFESFLAFLL